MSELMHSLANDMGHNAADTAAARASAASQAASAALTPQARAALQHLADVAIPPPVPWTPQTAGWAVLAVLLLLGLIWFIVWAVRHRRANRYRRVALTELKHIESRWRADDAAALADLPALLKRTALAAWPREAVAGLSGMAWVDFLAAHAGHARADVKKLKPLLDDAEYRTVTANLSDTGIPPNELIAACRHWIARHHRVSA